MTAGKMRERLSFQMRQAVDDGYGNEQSGGFVEQFNCSAEVIPLKGGEGVMQSRLTGSQPVIIRIRSGAAAKLVTTGWRAVDARNAGRIYNITAVANMDQKNAYLDIMAVSGVAV